SLYASPIAFWRCQNATSAHHWLAPECSNGLWALLDDQIFKVFEQACSKLCFAFAFLAEMDIGGARGMDHTIQCKIKALMVAWKACQRSRSNRHAVVALYAADNLFLLFVAERIGAIPNHLHSKVVGF